MSEAINGSMEALTNVYNTAHNLGDKLHVNIRLKKLAIKSLEHYKTHNREAGTTRQMLGGVGLGIGGVLVAAGIIVTIASGGIGAALLAPGLLIFGASAYITAKGVRANYKNVMKNKPNTTGHEFAKNTFMKIFAGAATGVLSLYGKGKKEKWALEVQNAENLNRLKTVASFLKQPNIPKKPKEVDPQTINLKGLNINNIGGESLSVLNADKINEIAQDKLKNAIIKEIGNLPLNDTAKKELKELVNNSKGLTNLSDEINKKIKELTSESLFAIIKEIKDNPKATCEHLINKLPTSLQDQIRQLVKDKNVDQLTALYITINDSTQQIKDIKNTLKDLESLYSQWDSLPEELEQAINNFINQNNNLQELTTPLRNIINILNNPNGILQNSDEAQQRIQTALQNAIRQLPKELHNPIRRLINEGKYDQLRNLLTVLNKEQEVNNTLNQQLNKLPSELQNLANSIILTSPVQALTNLLNAQTEFQIPELEIQKIIDKLPQGIQDVIQDATPNSIKDLYELIKDKPYNVLGSENTRLIVNKIIQQATPEALPYIMLLQDISNNLSIESIQNIIGNSQLPNNISKENIQKFIDVITQAIQTLEKTIIEKAIQAKSINVNGLIQDMVNHIKGNASAALANIDWIDTIIDLNIGENLRSVTSNL